MNSGETNMTKPKRKLGHRSGDRFTVIIRNRVTRLYSKYVAEYAKDINEARQEAEDTVGFWAEVVNVIRG